MALHALGMRTAMMLTVLLMAWPGDCLAEEYSYHIGDWDISYDNKTHSITLDKYNGTDAQVTTPTEFLITDEKLITKKYPVTGIGSSCFINKTTLTSVTVSEGIEFIGEKAFFDCSNLVSVSLPNGFEKIRKGCFFNCSKLEHITLPDQLTYIDEYAFFNCSSLSSITIPNSVIIIEQYAFGDCSSLESLTIPQSVKTIGQNAFDNCTGLTSVTINSSTIDIEESAFYKCENLKSVTFNNCSAIDIGNSAFEKLYNLKSVTFPESAALTIGEKAFYYCIGLTSINLPTGYKIIENLTFYNCQSLNNVTIPNTVTIIGKKAFGYCISLTNITIAHSVTTIESDAFFPCDNLKVITIPNSVIEIQTDALDCSSLQDVYYEGTKARWERAIADASPFGTQTPTVHWQCTATFNTNGHGTAPQAQTVYSGNSITAPATAPTAQGYGFGGWYTDAACTNGYDFTTKLSDNITLYAQWIPQSNTISFNTSGKGSAIASKTVHSGSTVEEPDVPFAGDEGIEGWYTDEGKTQRYDFSTPVDHSFTLYAKWAKAGSAVINSTAGGTVTLTDAKGQTYNNGKIMPGIYTLVIAPSSGYAFSGTYTLTNRKNGSSVDYNLGGTTTSYELDLTEKDAAINVTFTNQPIVTISETNDGTATGSMSLKDGLGTTFNNGDVLTHIYDVNSLTWSDNYNLVLDITGTCTGKIVNNGETTAITSNGKYTITPKGSVSIEVFFYGETKTYTLTFMSAGAVYTTDAKAFGEAVADPNAPTREGYTFLGWDTEIPATMPAKDLTFNALWKKQITITATSDSKVYDGRALINEGYTMTQLDEGDVLESVTVTGRQTNVGTSNNVPSDAVIRNAGGETVTDKYDLVYTNGTLEVTPKPVTVKADNLEKMSGEEDPSLTATVTGLIGEEAINYTLSRAEGDDPGTYTITPAGNGLQGNYSVTYETGTLTITAPSGQSESGTYQLSGDYVVFYDAQLDPITEAAAGETVIVGPDPNKFPQGKYFTHQYTATDGVTVTVEENGDGTFIMPAKNVSVSAVLAEQEEYTLNMTTTKPQVIPESVWLLLNCLDDNYVYDDETKEQFLELNGDGKRDVQLKRDYNETTEVTTYRAIRQPGADDITENLRFDVSYIEPLQYNSVLFLFKPQAIQSDWITVGDGTPLVYNGQAQTPAVVVKDGATTLSAETDYDVTYSNNMNACEATAENAPKVTVTAKATSTSYTGTATATFTIAPKVVTSPTITLSATSAAYDGSDLTPTVTAVKDGETTISNTEYIVSYKKGSEAVEKCIEPGEYTVVISDGEGGNYTVSGTATFTITKEAIDAVINLINDIGEVEYTEEGKTKIDAARTAYDALNDAQQKLVTNSATLTAAETTYAELKAEAEAQAAAELAAKQKAFEKEIKAEGYEGTYDGLTHSITVTAPEEATVKYGTEEGKYGSDNPSFKDAGTYTVYYEVSMEGLTSVTSSAEVKITRKALSLVADPVTITEGETLPTTFTGSITGFVTGEGLSDTDVLTFSLDNPEASAVGSYSITGTLNSATSGDYGQNYTFANAASNATALTINAKPTPDPTPEPTPTPIPTPEPAPEPAPDVIVFEAVPDNDATKELKKAISDAQDNNAIMDLLPENIQRQLPEDVTSVEAIQTFKLENYQESMGNVTDKASFQTPLEAGLDVTFVIALPGNDGEVAWYALGGTVNENGDVLVTLEKSIAIAINNQVFVAMVMVGGSPSGTITPTPTEANITIEDKDPWQLEKGENFTATIGETQYAPEEVNIDYTPFIMNGITVNATVSAEFESSTGNKATYRVTGNKATKLTFGEVEWKGTSALMTRPANISFSGADVDTSKLRFTNIQSLEANKKMTLVSDFGESVGTITGSKYMVGTAFEGEGKARLEGIDLIFATKTSAGQTGNPVVLDQNNSVRVGGTDMQCLSEGSQKDLAGVLDGTTLAMNANDADRVSVVKDEFGETVLAISQGPAMGVVLPGAQKGDVFVLCESDQNTAQLDRNSTTYANNDVLCPIQHLSRSRARGAGDEMIKIVSGQKYVVLKDGPLVLTFCTENGPIFIENITLEKPDPNDLNHDGKVNAVDLVKAISDGKTQAEIDEIVNSIMNIK